MPRISYFFGIAIRMFFNDHMPPHFHAEYGGFEAVYGIERLELLRGNLPRRAHALVLEWASLRRLQLLEDWGRAVDALPLQEIEPLE